MFSLTEEVLDGETGAPTPRSVADRLKYGSNWNNLGYEEEDAIYDALVWQADTTHYKKSLHPMVAEWINENYDLYLEVESYDPCGGVFEVETVQVRVTTTPYGGSVYLDVPGERSPIAKKSYTGTPDLGYAIDDAMEAFAESRDLFTRGVLNEVEVNGEIDPERLQGIEKYVYERVAGDFGRRYLRLLENQISGLIKVEKE